MTPAIIALCIPLVAIIGSYYVKVQKMRLQHQAGDGVSPRLLQDMAERIRQLEEENRSLRTRVENVEVIVTDTAFFLPPPDQSAKAQVPPTTQQIVEEMARKARNS